MEEQQVVSEDPRPISTRDGKELHATETQSNPETTVTTQESVHERTEKNILPEAAQAPWKDNSKANIEQVAHIKQTGPDDLDLQMAESEGEKLGQVGWEWQRRCRKACGERSVPDTQGAPSAAGQAQSQVSAHPSAELLMGRTCWGGSRAVASLEGSGYVCQWEAQGNAGT